MTRRDNMFSGLREVDSDDRDYGISVAWLGLFIGILGFWTAVAALVESALA